MAHELKEIRYQFKTYARFANTDEPCERNKHQRSTQTADEVQELFANLEILRYGAALDKRYLKLETDVGLRAVCGKNARTVL